MDQVEKWLVEKRDEWYPSQVLQRFALTALINAWHEEGAAVLAQEDHG